MTEERKQTPEGDDDDQKPHIEKEKPEEGQEETDQTAGEVETV